MSSRLIPDANRPIADRASSVFSNNPLARGLSELNLPRHKLASVTVGSSPPRPYAAGPGKAPALRGPTSIIPPSPNHAMLPPPAPKVAIASCGDRLGKPVTCCSVVSGRTRSSIKQTSVLVPPISQVIKFESPVSLPSSMAAATPPAGPDNTVCTGNSPARFGPTTPPFDVIRKMAPANPLVSSCDNSECR